MFKALLISIGMFSIIPMPQRIWDERFLPWVIPWMPFVGGLLGGIWYVTACSAAGLPAPIQTAVVMVVPWVLSGFLHLDGFMDVVDAYFSRRDLEEMKRILKDAHVGAFAVIASASLFLFQFCVIQTILTEKKSLIPLLFIPILSRCIMGLMLLILKPMSETGFAVTFKKNTNRWHILFLFGWLIVTFAASTTMGWKGLVVAAVTVAVGAMIMLHLARKFQGISGDLCGCAITLSELSGLFVISLI